MLPGFDAPCLRKKRRQLPVRVKPRSSQLQPHASTSCPASTLCRCDPRAPVGADAAYRLPPFLFVADVPSSLVYEGSSGGVCETGLTSTRSEKRAFARAVGRACMCEGGWPGELIGVSRWYGALYEVGGTWHMWHTSSIISSICAQTLRTSFLLLSCSSPLINSSSKI